MGTNEQALGTMFETLLIEHLLPQNVTDIILIGSYVFFVLALCAVELYSSHWRPLPPYKTCDPESTTDPSPPVV